MSIALLKMCWNFNLFPTTILISWWPPKYYFHFMQTLNRWSSVSCVPPRPLKERSDLWREQKRIRGEVRSDNSESGLRRAGEGKAECFLLILHCETDCDCVQVCWAHHTRASQHSDLITGSMPPLPENDIDEERKKELIMEKKLRACRVNIIQRVRAFIRNVNLITELFLV